MKTPQTENGYTRIANELLEAIISSGLSGREMEIVFCVIRMTYGFHKKEDWISYSTFEKMTGQTRSTVWRSLEKLVAWRILVASKQPGKTFYRLNKDYSQWAVARTQLVASRKRSSCVEEIKVVASAQPTKETITKETIQKKTIVEPPVLRKEKKADKKKIFDLDSDAYKLSELLYQKCIENNPNFPGRDLQSWAKHMDLLLRVDKYPPRLVEAVIKWCQADSFWKCNILSTSKLRKQFPQLILKAKEHHEKNTIVVI